MPLFADKASAITKIRDFIRDTPALNALLDGVETSDTLIEFCLEMALDDFNTSPPLIGTFDLVGHPSQSLILAGTVSWILKSAGLGQSRNQLDYSSGGVTVASSNKTPLYQSWVNLFMNEFEAKKANLKKSLNAEQAYGGIFSEYAAVNTYGGLPYFGASHVALVRNGVFL